MKLNTLFVAVLATLMIVPVAQAADVPKEDENALFAEATLTYHANKEKPVFTEALYLEKGIGITGGLSVWGVASTEPGFNLIYVGLSKKVGDWQLALGAGCAWYGGTCHVTVNPWAYYEKDGLTIFLNAEHYSREKDDPRFYLGYVHKKLIENSFLGIHAKSDFGIGPMAGVAFSNSVKGYVVVPVASRPEDKNERTKWMIRISVTLPP